MWRDCRTAYWARIVHLKNGLSWIGLPCRDAEKSPGGNVSRRKIMGCARPHAAIESAGSKAQQNPLSLRFYRDRCGGNPPDIYRRIVVAAILHASLTRRLVTTSCIIVLSGYLLRSVAGACLAGGPGLRPVDVKTLPLGGNGTRCRSESRSPVLMAV